MDKEKLVFAGSKYFIYKKGSEINGAILGYSKSYYTIEKCNEELKRLNDDSLGIWDFEKGQPLITNN